MRYFCNMTAGVIRYSESSNIVQQAEMLEQTKYLDPL
jgi:hypothetical protein